MAKIRIPAALLDSITAYTASAQQSEVDDATLILPILEKHFQDLEALQQDTISKLEAITVTDGMVKSAMSVVDKS